jgi:hypothetical protein
MFGKGGTSMDVPFIELEESWKKGVYALSSTKK